MSKKTNIITAILTILILVGYYFFHISPYYIVALAISYIAILTLGVLNINFNYFFHSHCNSATSKKEIAITFDDGPHPNITPKLLKLLGLHNIPATFFCTGKNITAYSEIASSIYKNNHIIGNHSFSHSNFFDLFSSASMQQEIEDANIAITKEIGKTPLLFRPPFGITNPLLRKAIKKTKMTSVGWSLRPFDSTMNTKYIISKLKSNTKAGDIVLFHDTNPNIITIIEEYIIWLHKNDFKIVSLTNLLNIPAYAED